MDLHLEHVYCFRRGSEDCFKIGRTCGLPENRKPGISTGSPLRLNLHRTVETENSVDLEMYIHKLLDQRRTENGEFFNVTAEELDSAVDRAIAFMGEFQPLSQEAGKFRRLMPKETVKESSPEMIEVYQQLRKLSRERDLIDWQIALLKNKIQIAIGDSSAMENVASWEWVERWTMDIERFKKEQGQMYEEYKRNSSCRIFRLARVDLTLSD
jgi:hypothetical protein